jgi:hypothetical protein
MFITLGILGISVITAIIYKLFKMKKVAINEEPVDYNVSNGLTVNTNVLAVRKNNPGNIRDDGKSQWQGMTGVDDKGFCVFDTSDYGARAMVLLLRNYSKNYGLDTIKEIISRYAPSSENDTDSYINVIAFKTGLGTNDKLNLQFDYEPLSVLAYYMHIHEAGFAWVKYEIFLKYAQEFTQ